MIPSWSIITETLVLVNFIRCYLGTPRAADILILKPGAQLATSYPWENLIATGAQSRPVPVRVQAPGKVAPVDTDRDTITSPSPSQGSSGQISVHHHLNNGPQTFHPGFILQSARTVNALLDSFQDTTGSWLECPEYLIRQEQNDIKIIPLSLSQPSWLTIGL